MDKNRRTFFLCKACSARTFIRDESRTYGPRLLDLVAKRLGHTKLGFLFTWYDPELVLKALDAELAPLLDPSITRAVESVLDALTGMSDDPHEQAELVKLLDQLDDLEAD